MLKGLERRPFWKFDASRSLEEDVQMLEKCKDKILEEYRHVESLMSWEENRTSSGVWNTYYLVNQVSCRFLDSLSFYRFCPPCV